MGSLIGNKNAVGNRGGGRMTIKEEEWHVSLWQGRKGKKDGELNPWDVDELEKKIQSKKYAGRDMYALRVLKGDPMILKNLADKILADLHDVKSGGQAIGIPILGNALLSNDSDKQDHSPEKTD